MLATTLSAALTLVGCSGAGSDATAVDKIACPTESAAGCAPIDKRVDTYIPKFSHPTKVTNPLLPISRLESVVYVGTVGGAPFRTETTLLPQTKVIEYEGQGIEALVSQYMAFSYGRIEEIAVDYYAQDDVGAVWYLGEDVADYDETGVIYTHEGTWHAGVEGPIAMNMPPTVGLGDAWLAENAAPEAWEQITVESVDGTREGPSGAIPGCVVTAELKLDNAGEEKVFAPGYGELSTGSLATDNLEALALAIPQDALAENLPVELTALTASTSVIFQAAEAANWGGAATALDAVKKDWQRYRRSATVPPRLEAEVERLLLLVAAGVEAGDRHATRHQAIDLTRFVYDLRLRYQPSTEINRVRFDLWLAQIQVDAAAGEAGPIKGDTATLELVWARIAHTFDATQAAEIEDRLAELRLAADAEDAKQTSETAIHLRDSFASMGWN